MTAADNLHPAQFRRAKGQMRSDWAASDQAQRTEAEHATRGGGKLEMDEHYGRGEYEGAARSTKRVTLKDFLREQRNPDPDRDWSVPKYRPSSWG